MTNSQIENRIKELRNIQKSEVENNFKNDNLWDECEDKIYFLKTYRQENEPKKTFDKFGNESGYILEDGTQVTYSGMTYGSQY
jgi:hypothetical protein